MPCYSDAYRDLQSRFHEERPDYGISGQKHVEYVLHLSDQLKTRDVLDYACGKATLQKGLPFPIQNYDPFVEEYSKRPNPAKLVVCTDVLEHIEPECLAEVLDDLHDLTRQLLYVNVSTQLASKTLPDGRNAHLLVQPPNWWLTWLLPRFALHSFQVQPGCFTALLTPLDAPGPAIQPPQ